MKQVTMELKDAFFLGIATMCLIDVILFGFFPHVMGGEPVVEGYICKNYKIGFGAYKIECAKK